MIKQKKSAKSAQPVNSVDNETKPPKLSTAPKQEIPKELDSKQIAEVGFWKGLYAQIPDYRTFRHEDGRAKMKIFTDLPNREGQGLDVGCGLISIFERFSNTVVAIDPLVAEYRKIADMPDTERVKYLCASGENIPFEDNHFDYVCCVNVIDHTPHPKKMAEEIARVLKPGGLLFFEVNFDDNLAPPHYFLWDQDIVAEHFKDILTLKSKHTERNNVDFQYLFHAIYEKPNA